MIPVIEPAAPGDAPALADILSDWIGETARRPKLHSREEARGFLASLIREMPA